MGSTVKTPQFQIRLRELLVAFIVICAWIGAVAMGYSYSFGGVFAYVVTLGAVALYYQSARKLGLAVGIVHTLVAVLTLLRASLAPAGPERLMIVLLLFYLDFPLAGIYRWLIDQTAPHDILIVWVLPSLVMGGVLQGLIGYVVGIAVWRR